MLNCHQGKKEDSHIWINFISLRSHPLSKLSHNLLVNKWDVCIIYYGMITFQIMYLVKLLVSLRPWVITTNSNCKCFKALKQNPVEEFDVRFIDLKCSGLWSNQKTREKAGASINSLAFPFVCLRHAILAQA